MTETAGAGRDALELALERVGDRWALLLVEALLEGPSRFSELQRRLPGIASNVLAERLRRLEAAQVVSGRRYSERPPRLEYRLTPEGSALAAVVEALRRWGGGSEAGPSHRVCGTATELRWYCPTCARVVPPGELGQDDDVVFA